MSGVTDKDFCKTQIGAIAQAREEAKQMGRKYDDALRTHAAAVGGEVAHAELEMTIAKRNYEAAQAVCEKLEQLEHHYVKAITATDAPQETVTRLRVLIPRGAQYPGLRRRVYDLATQNRAYDEQIAYDSKDADGVQISDDLKVELYFEDLMSAKLGFNKDLVAHCNKHAISVVNTTITADPDHTLTKLTSFAQYDAKYSPERCVALSEASSSASATTRVPEERAKWEYLVSDKGFQATHARAEKCHLIPRHICKGDARDTDYCNFILLPSELHKSFDMYADVAFSGKEQPSSYEEAPEGFRNPEERGKRNPPPEDLPRYRVTLVVTFSTPELAEHWSGMLRTSTPPSTGECTFEVVIKHPFPREFLEYVAIRHEVQKRAMKLDGFNPKAKYPDLVYTGETEVSRQEPASSQQAIGDETQEDTSMPSGSKSSDSSESCYFAGKSK